MIFEKKTRVFCLNGGFAKRKLDFQVKWEISEEKTRDFRLNGGFEKRKRVIFASMADVCRENACFPHKQGICKLKTCDVWVNWEIFEEKTRVFHINGGFAKRKCVIFRLNAGFAKRKHAMFA